MAILLLKLFLAPSLVVASTLAGRRWGPGVAGVLVGLPLVAGPILLIIYLQNGADFTAGAARSSLLGLVSLAVFGVVYARTARRLTWPPTLALTWAAVLVADAALSEAHVPLPVAVACTLTAAIIAMTLMPRTTPDLPPIPAHLPAPDGLPAPDHVPGSDHEPTSVHVPGPDHVAAPDHVSGSEHVPAPDRSAGPVRTRAPAWDLPARAVATGVLVLTVTTASTVLGPQWTGVLAPFPIATSVVTAFTHAQRGPAATARTLDGVLLTLFAFPVFCVVVATLVRPLGAAAFVLAAPLTVAVQLLAGRTRTALRTRRA